MEPQPDFRELPGLFEEHNVDYLVVGASALAFHGVPRGPPAFAGSLREKLRSPLS